MSKLADGCKSLELGNVTSLKSRLDEKGFNQIKVLTNSGYQQYKENGVWVLTKTNTYNYPKSDGTIGTYIQTEWTEKGRRFIHELYDKGRI